jgi:hypothetical protein
MPGMTHDFFVRHAVAVGSCDEPGTEAVRAKLLYKRASQSVLERSIHGPLQYAMRSSRHPLPGRFKSGAATDDPHIRLCRVVCKRRSRRSAPRRRRPASIRSECLGHIMVMGERDLGHQLTNRATYHSPARTHLALDKDAPLRRPAQKLGRIMSVPWLGGLHHQYVWMA